MAASRGFNYVGLSPKQQERLREIVGCIHSFGCQQTGAAVDSGKMLNEAKVGLEGRFGEWCLHEAGYRARKAQLLVNLATFAKREPDVLLIPVSAAYKVSAPAAPAHIVKMVLSRAKDGGRVTVAWVEELFDSENGKEPRSQRSDPSEITKIAKLLASAIGPAEATALRKLLEVVGATWVRHILSDLQDQLRDKLRDTDASFDHAVHQPAVGL